MTAFLLASGADPQRPGPDATTPVQDAETRGHWPAAKPPTAYHVRVTEGLSLAPFHVDAREDGAHVVWLSDSDMVQVEDVFDDIGAESNGYGWESLAWWITHTEMPELADPIWFSCEGGTFVAGSSDPAALRRLAERLHAAYHDRSLLAQLVTQAETD
jgi:hypothetical protein